MPDQVKSKIQADRVKLLAKTKLERFRSIGNAPVRGALMVLALLSLSGCGLAAAPCRVGSAIIKIVPVVGHAAATPTDACAAAIDP